jgi:hypothetical protein
LAWQRELSLGDSDFAAMDPVYVRLEGRLNSVAQEARAYADNHRIGADRRTLQSFSDRADALILACIADLRSKMSTSGFAVLTTFVGGKFRANSGAAPLASR